MLFVTLHGGKPQQDPHKNNIQAFDADGKRLTSSVLDDHPAVVLNELRAIYFARNLLYVVNANKEQNSVLCYEGVGTKYQFVGTFVSRAQCSGILHPFDLAFDDDQHCYLSSQDTNVVTRFQMSADGRTGTPAAIAPALPAAGKFSPGTFIASSVGYLEPPTTPVPPPEGLEYYAPAGDKKHSVRGIAWAGGALYVVDQPSGRVKVYDAKGKLVGQSNKVETPVHVAPWKGRLYVTGADEVLSASLPRPAGDFELRPIKGVKVKNSSGMAFTDSGHFYVASRTENEICKFDCDFRPVKFGCKLADNPEFLLHV